MKKNTLFSFTTLFVSFLAAQSELINDPSLKPADPYVASADAAALKNAILDGRTINNDKVADILCQRTYAQRLQTSNCYDNLVLEMAQNKLLFFMLESMSHDSMEALYNVMFVSSEKLLAKTVYESISGKWKEVGAIEEVVCANDQNMKKLIQQVYQAEYKTNVELHLATFHGDDKGYQEVMIKYCWTTRCQEKKITPEVAANEAKALQEIDPEKDKEGFKNKLKEYLDKYCEPDLKLIFEKYEKDGHKISDGVDAAFCNREKTAYNVLVRYIESTCRFYADELHHAVHGFGTDIDKINRIIVTRCERDLTCILNDYKKYHKKSFTKRLKSDTLGEPRYRKCIKYLCGET